MIVYKCDACGKELPRPYMDIRLFDFSRLSIANKHFNLCEEHLEQCIGLLEKELRLKIRPEKTIGQYDF